MVSTRSVMCSLLRCCLISAKVASDMPMSRTISRAPLRIALASGSGLERLPSGFGKKALDVLVSDAEFLADLHVMGEFVLRLLHPADLQDGQLAQPRIERALVAD